MREFGFLSTPYSTQHSTTLLNLSSCVLCVYIRKVKMLLDELRYIKCQQRQQRQQQQHHQRSCVALMSFNYTCRTHTRTHTLCNVYQISQRTEIGHFIRSSCSMYVRWQFNFYSFIPSMIESNMKYL